MLNKARPKKIRKIAASDERGERTCGWAHMVRAIDVAGKLALIARAIVSLVDLIKHLP